MAERRMFAKTIIDSDAFLDMPQTAQLLYFHLAMRADDDGFINNPKSIMRNVRCNDDDVRLLITKKFLIPFESGVVVIKHWKIHNYIAKDRYKETKYKEEKASLTLDENNSYTSCIQNVYELDTQVRLGKDSIDIKEEEKNPKPKKTNFDLIIEEEKFSNETVERLNDFIKMRKSIKKPLTDRALKIAINKLKKFSSSEEEMRAILDRSILNSWQDLYELKPEDKKKFIKKEQIEYKVVEMTEAEYFGQGGKMKYE